MYVIGCLDRADLVDERREHHEAIAVHTTPSVTIDPMTAGEGIAAGHWRAPIGT
jgi:hypothetical protein